MKLHERSFMLENSLVRREASDFEKFGAFLRRTEQLEAENASLREALRAVTDRLETVLRYHGGTDAQIATHPDLCAALNALGH